MSVFSRDPFETWLARVDAVLLRRYGIKHTDLADWQWRDAYDDELSPAHAAIEAISNEWGS